MTSAPPLRNDSATPSGDRGERQATRACLAVDRMVVSFAVSVSSRRGDVTTEDARRVAMVRRVTRARLRYCGLHALVDDATLIVSELVTNAILHSGGSQVTLTMVIRGGVLRLAVHDEMPGVPATCIVDSDSERGRGLFLVDFLARENGGKWGATDEGATIYCELALPGVAQ